MRDSMLKNMTISKEKIARILKSREKELKVIKQKIRGQIIELNTELSEKRKDHDILAIALKGKPTSTEKLSPTNAEQDILGNILNSYYKQRDEKINDCRSKLQILMDEEQLIHQVWNIYLSLDTSLFEILQLRFVKGYKWSYLEETYGWSKREISERQNLALRTIQNEIQRGKGAKVVYKPPKQRKQSQNPQGNGQLTLDLDLLKVEENNL